MTKPRCPSAGTVSFCVSPVPTVAVRAVSSIATLFIRLTSMTRPPSSEDQPSRLWRPLRARRAMPSSRAHSTALTTSCASRQNTIASG